MNQLGSFIHAATKAQNREIEAVPSAIYVLLMGFHGRELDTRIE